MKRFYWILILVVLVGGGVAAARFVQRGETETRQHAIDEIEEIEFALDRYARSNGDYPSTEQGLSALWERPTGFPAPTNWTGPYLTRPILTDPWGNPYVYQRPGRNDRYTYDLFSYGADGVEGGRGENEDIVSWLRPEEL
ncbi:MAG: type II secretion system major pseudopilin GspG [Candidatus Poribacteria bacterium]|nr:type II secretion system major pseudopilin GspG [Candidatus Poribacteria bacterium]